MTTVVAAIAVAVPSAAQADPGDGWFSYQNTNSLLFLAVNGGSDANGAKIIQYHEEVQEPTDQPIPDQDWRIVPREGQWVTLFNAGTSPWKVLGVSGGSKANGAKIIQWEYEEDNRDQQWDVVSAGGTRVYLLNRNSNKCLAIPAGSHRVGEQAIQWTCNGGTEQIWDQFDDDY
ncbi:RICIN domain-containing protein [Actinoplanes sp. CA-252034]|uniref:RICIN domain-containing protein n=1 Tax=Actinoplanes sp. CA-252034 TaxID=3239906 RepID=UPI003D957DA6